MWTSGMIFLKKKTEHTGSIPRTCMAARVLKNHFTPINIHLLTKLARTYSSQIQCTVWANCASVYYAPCMFYLFMINFFSINRTHRVHTKHLLGCSSSQKPFHTDQYTFADETCKNIFRSNPVHSMDQLCRRRLLATPTKPDLQYRIIDA